MSVLGIDPATVSGWAYKDGGVWHCGTVSADNRAGMAGVITFAKGAGVTKAYIEDCFLGKNPKTFARLVEIKKEWVDLCTEHGLECTMIAAMTWKRAMLTVAGDFPEGSHAQKIRALWVAEKALGATCKNDHEGDAVCISECSECMEKRRAEL